MNIFIGKNYTYVKLFLLALFFGSTFITGRIVAMLNAVRYTLVYSVAIS